MSPIIPGSASTASAHTFKNITASQPSSPMSSQSSWTGETISTVAFGIVALAIGTVTIWQAHRTWKLWHKHRTLRPDPQHDEGDTGVELPTRTNTGTSTQEELHSALGVSDRASHTNMTSAGGGASTLTDGREVSRNSVE